MGNRLLAVAVLAIVAFPAVTEAQVAPSDPVYRAAYANACINGYIDAGRPGVAYADLDPARYASDPRYRQGWDDGYSTCYDREYRTPKMQRH